MGSAAGEFILRTLAAFALFDLRGFAALARFLVVFLVLHFAIAVGLVRASPVRAQGQSGDTTTI